MPNYYLIDTTTKKDNKSAVVIFSNTDSLITRLEEACKRRFGQTRKEYMFACSELGFGEDDAQGRAFYEQMEQYFNMGVIRKDSAPIRCNIFQADQFSRGKSEYGN